MVRFQRTMRVKPGKLMEAIKWAKEVAGFVNAQFEDQNDLQVFVLQFGDYGTIAWAVDVEDAATLSQNMSQLIADPSYWAVVNQGADLAVEATGQDSLWQEV